MARRPDFFDREKLEAALREQGCSESWVDTVVSNFRLILPVLLKELGADGITDTMMREQSTYGRHSPDDVWRNIAKPLVSWATDVLASETDESH